QRYQADAAATQIFADLAIEDDVGAAEFVDGLLRIADQKELSGRGSDLEPVGFLGVGRREQKENLGLQRIGILKFVHKQVRKTFLQITADVFAGNDQIADTGEQIDKIEFAGLLFSMIVLIDQAGHFVAQDCG